MKNTRIDKHKIFQGQNSVDDDIQNIQNTSESIICTDNQG